MNIDAVRHTVTLSSNITGGCEHCGYFPAANEDHRHVTESINHYIEAHGYRLLHVGTETINSSEGKPWHTTVAILGHDDPPKKKPIGEVKIGWIGDRDNKT